MEDLDSIIKDPRVTLRRSGEPAPNGRCVVYWMQHRRQTRPGLGPERPVYGKIRYMSYDVRACEPAIHKTATRETRPAFEPFHIARSMSFRWSLLKFRLPILACGFLAQIQRDIR